MDDKQQQLRSLIELIDAEDVSAISRQLYAPDDYGVWSGAEKSPSKIAAYFDRVFHAARAISQVVDDQSGETVLTYATRKGNLHIIKGILKFHIMIDAPRRDGQTPLSVAYASGHVDIAKNLIMQGADPRLVSLRTEFTSREQNEIATLISERIQEHERMSNAIQALLTQTSNDPLEAELQDVLQRGALISPVGPPIPAHPVIWNCQTRSKLNTELDQAVMGYERLLKNLTDFHEQEITVTSVKTNSVHYEIFLAPSLTRFLGVLRS